MSALLERLLAEERRALVAGDFDALPKLIAKTEKALAAFEAAPGAATRAQVARLKREARRNATLLDAALAGIGAAQARLAVLRKGAPGGTYGADGRRVDIARTAPSIQKRA